MYIRNYVAGTKTSLCSLNSPIFFLFCHFPEERVFSYRYIYIDIDMIADASKKKSYNIKTGDFNFLQISEELNNEAKPSFFLFL